MDLSMLDIFLQNSSQREKEDNDQQTFPNMISDRRGGELVNIEFQDPLQQMRDELQRRGKQKMQLRNKSLYEFLSAGGGGGGRAAVSPAHHVDKPHAYLVYMCHFERF